MRSVVLGSVLVLAGAGALTSAGAQTFSTSPCHDDNNGSGGGWFGHQERACEIRSTTYPLNGNHLSVTGQNGGIQVIGEDRRDVALEVKVTAQAPSQGEADALLHQIEVTTGSDVRAHGPNNNNGLSRRSWSVSFKLHVPKRIAQTEFRTSNGTIEIADLEGSVNASSTNGGIRASRISGDVNASSTNGGLTLDGLGGTVHAETTNGGVQIALAGERWRGSGLFAKSTNGGISVKAPEHFAAHLVADTTNGGISVGFPVTIQGKIRKHIDTDLNGGGPPVRLETTNGGVTIGRS